MERIHTTRKPKLQYPQAAPPTPRILHLPRRYGVRRISAKTKTPLSSQKDQRQRLEVLFEQERSFDRRRSPPAIVVVNEEDEAAEERGRGGSSSSAMAAESEAEEAKWRFQAEMLRAECNLLRMEKEIAVKKMERRRERMEKTLGSAVHSLVFGKQKISEGKNVNKVLEQEISHLVEKLHELSKPLKMKDVEARACRHNFDRQASVLRRRLEKFDGVSQETCVKEIRELAEASFSVQPSSPVDQDFLPNNSVNINILRSNMEALSTGTLLERIDREYGSIVLIPTSSDSERVQRMNNKDTKVDVETKECSRHCKAVVRRITEEVKAEAEQWSQMQEMLGQVREEMEELRASRDFWQDRSLDADCQIQNLRSSAQEWRKRALSSEAKAKSLQEEVCALRGKLDRTRKDHPSEADIKSLPSETEKRVLICRLKENRHTNNEDHQSKHQRILSEGRRKTQSAARSRVPLREIRNRSTATSSSVS